MMDKNITIELIVSADRVSIEDMSDFKIGIGMHNEGEQEVSIDLSKSELSVNRQRSHAWDLAVQNGTIINMTIAARKVESVTWPLGKALFQKAGKYTLALLWGDYTEKKEIIVFES